MLFRSSSFLLFFTFASVILLLKAPVSHSQATLTQHNRALEQLQLDHHDDTNRVLTVKSGIYGDTMTVLSHVMKKDERDLLAWTDDESKTDKKNYGPRSNSRFHRTLALSSESSQECRCAYPGERVFSLDTMTYNKGTTNSPKSKGGGWTQARHYTTPRDIDNRRALKGAKSSKNSAPYTNWEKTSTFDVSSQIQRLQPHFLAQAFGTNHRRLGA